MALTRSQVRSLYRRRARHYDRLVGVFRLVGADGPKYRRHAVEALTVGRGESVVEIGCGTGANFSLLQRAVGNSGHILAVDPTDAMLVEARQRVKRAGWANVDLVEADAADYRFASNIDGVLSTFAVTVVDDYDGVVRRAAGALRPGGRVVILEMKTPERLPRWAIRFGSWLLRPYGVNPGYANRTPRKSVNRHLDEVLYRGFYGGSIHLCVGARRG